MDSPAIVVSHLTQRFRVIHERPNTLRELFTTFFRHKTTQHDFEAVSNVTFSVRKGEMLGIVGRNGSGKSTVLKTIAGVYRPTQGTVDVSGTVAPLIELGTGFHAELTGRENILLNGLLMGYSKRAMLEREERIIEFAELGDFIDTPVKQYSSGMYMRLAFAVATEVDPDVLLLDEILAVGDTAFQAKCFDRLKRFRQSGMTILLVTHSLHQVTSMCDRAILLEDGKLKADGDPSDVVALYEGRATLEEAGVG